MQIQWESVLSPGSVTYFSAPASFFKNSIDPPATEPDTADGRGRPLQGVRHDVQLSFAFRQLLRETRVQAILKLHPILLIAFCGASLHGQINIISAGYGPPAHTLVVPGQVLTLFARGYQGSRCRGYDRATADHCQRRFRGSEEQHSGISALLADLQHPLF